MPEKTLTPEEKAWRESVERRLDRVIEQLERVVEKKKQAKESRA